MGEGTMGMNAAGNCVAQLRIKSVSKKSPGSLNAMYNIWDLI